MLNKNLYKYVLILARMIPIIIFCINQQKRRYEFY